MEALPDDILLKIFTFVPHDELCLAVRMTCSRWHHLSKDKELWKYVEIAEHVTDTRLEALLSEISGLVEELDLNKCENLTEQSFMNMALMEFPRLTKLVMPVLTSFPDSVYESLVKSFPHLESLWNVRSNVDQTCNPLYCQSLFISLKAVHDMPVSSFGRIRNVVPHLNEKKHKEWESGLSRIASQCQPITHYSCFRGMGYVDDKGLGKLSTLFPKLKILELRHCTITDSAWEIFFNNQENKEGLKEIVLDKAGEMTDKSLKIIADNCPNLDKFKIARCMGITPAGVTYLVDRCKSIRELHVNNSESVLQKPREMERKDIDDACVNSVATNCGQMVLFRVCNSRVLTGLGVESLCEGCPYLLGLMLYECEVIDDRSLLAMAGLRFLRGLVLVGCDRITPGGVADLVLTAPSLHRLTLHVSNGNRLFCEDQSELWDKVYERIEAEEATLRPSVVKKLALKGIGSGFLMLITVLCPNLLSLDLSEPNIINNHALGLVIKNCDNLKVLDVSSPEHLLEDTLMDVIRQLTPNLKKLSLGSAAKNLSSAAIAAVITSCPSLCMLSLDTYGTSIDESHLVEQAKQTHGGRCFLHLHPDCREHKEVNYHFISLHMTPIKYLSSVNVVSPPE